MVKEIEKLRFFFKKGTHLEFSKWGGYKTEEKPNQK